MNESERKFSAILYDCDESVTTSLSRIVVESNKYLLKAFEYFHYEGRIIKQIVFYRFTTYTFHQIS